jgi:N-acetyl-anhydromuramyl-L-alanine amidase AmpD
MLTPRIAPKLLTNEAYGYPRGEERRIMPLALICIHQTANPKNPPASATAERNYANRDGSNGPSAHFYTDRTGVLVQAIDWQRFAAWSNGDMKEPRLDNAGVAAIARMKAVGTNPNECFGIEVENCARDPEYPITGLQITSAAYLTALAKLEWPEIPINRTTVLLHSDLNTVDKMNCPVPDGKGEAFAAEVIRQALDFFEVMALEAQVADLEAIVAALRQENAAQAATIKAQTTRTDSLLALTEAQEATIAALNATIGEWKAYGETQRSDAGAMLARDFPADPT